MLQRLSFRRRSRGVLHCHRLPVPGTSQALREYKHQCSLRTILLRCAYRSVLNDYQHRRACETTSLLPFASLPMYRNIAHVSSLELVVYRFGVQTPLTQIIGQERSSTRPFKLTVGRLTRQESQCEPRVLPLSRIVHETLRTRSSRSRGSQATADNTKMPHQ